MSDVSVFCQALLHLLPSNQFLKPKVKSDDIGFQGFLVDDNNCPCGQYITYLNKVHLKNELDLLRSVTELRHRLELNNDFALMCAKGGAAILSLYSLNGFIYNSREHLRQQYAYVPSPDIVAQVTAKRDICPISATFQTFVLLNAAVYLAWKKEEWHPVLEQYFVLSQHPDSKNVINLVLCAFSHIGVAHLFSNMVSMHGSLEVWKKTDHSSCNMMNSCHGGELFSFCLASCIASSLGGLGAKMYLGIENPSIGASGLGCSLMAYELCVMPQSDNNLARLTGRSITSKDLLKLIIMFDLVAFIHMVQTRKIDPEFVGGIDYAVHLSGYTFGIMYAHGLDDILLGLGRYFASVVQSASKFCFFCLK